MRGGRPPLQILNALLDLFIGQRTRCQSRWHDYRLYVGAHGMAHHLEIVLEAARELISWKDIVFLLVGDGAERSRLVAMRDEMTLQNVVMLDQQPKERMPDLWSLSSVRLVLLKKSDLFKTVIPSKIFESLALEKPIILGVEGESAELVMAAGATFWRISTAKSWQGS
jgi:glycosyltransferase involved in cell wall biosynthesis